MLQNQLFPALREEVGALSPRHEQLAAVLGMLGLDSAVLPRRGRGRRGHDRVKIARAFIAKAVFQLPSTRALLERLRCDGTLRRICGWERAASLPEETVLSRAFARFAASQLPQRLHSALVGRTQKQRLVGHIVRDSTAIEAREKAQRKTAAQPRQRSWRNRSGKPKAWEKMTRLERQCSGKWNLENMLADLPQACDAGCKNNSRGNKSVWVGYKLHLDVADGQIPISAILTSASVHDSQAAVPLALLSSQRVTNCYDLADSAYDNFLIREHSRGLGHVAIIEPQKRGKTFVPLCPHERVRFRERSSIERVFSRLKDEFGGRFVRVRGACKVMAHLMFGLLALTADQILRLGGIEFANPATPVP